MNVFKLTIGQCFIVLYMIICVVATTGERDFEELYDSLLARNTPPEVIHENAVQIVKQMMNFSVDPCDDFYEFSCGNFKTVNKYDENFFEMIKRKAFQAAKNLIRETNVETVANSESSFFRYDRELRNISPAEWKAKTYFNSCMDIKAKKLIGIKPAIECLKDYVNETFSKSYSDEEAKKWVMLLRGLRSFGDIPLYKVVWDSKSYALKVGDLALKWNLTEKNFQLRLQERNENLAYVKKILNIYEVDSSRIQEVAAEIVEFDRILAEVSLPKASVNKNWFSLNELNTKYPRFHWNIYLYVRERDKKKWFLDTDLLNNLNNIMETNSLSTLNNYLQFRFARILLNFTSEFEGTAEELENFCFDALKVNMETALSGISLRRFLTKQIENDISSMINAVDDEFINLVSNSDHLSEDVKEAFIEKARKTGYILGVENYLELYRGMKSEYWGLSFKSEDFFDAALQMLAFRYESKEISPIKALTVNAFYNPSLSRRWFPLGFMLPTAYHINFPKWINYGNFGGIIGHELIHAFDTTRFLYKVDGKQKQDFSLSTILHHFKISLCLARQYNERGIDGVNTLTENYADLGGLIIAYEAYKKLLNGSEELAKSEQPQDLNLTPNQLFFVSYAQHYCDKNGEKSSKTHAPNKYRVNGPIINMDVFSDAFQCPVDSSMNPSKKCKFL